MNVSTMVTRRGSKRARSAGRRPRMAVQRVPRTIRYNGINKITRVVTTSVPYNNLGFKINSSFYQALNIVFDPTSVTFYASSTQFASTVIPNSAEITALYDMLSIDKVEITWSSNQQALTNSGAVVGCPKFLLCNDANDGIGAASLAEIQQQPNKEYYSVNGSSHRWSVRPKFQRVIFQSGLVSNYEPTRGFVNSNSTVPHYGTKIAITNLSSIGETANGDIDFSFKIFFSLKNVK